MTLPRQHRRAPTLQLEVALLVCHVVVTCCESPSAGSHATSEEYALTLTSKTSQHESISVRPAPQQTPRLPAQLSEVTVPPHPGFETH